MKRIYDYHGYRIDVEVEAAMPSPAAAATATSSAQFGAGGRPAGFVAVVRILRTGSPVSPFAPLRLSDAGGQPFINDVDALMGGYSAGRRLIDDVSVAGDA